MKHVMEKSFNKLAKNPSITLLLVTYFLITASCIPIIAFQYNRPAFFIVISLLLLLSGAFFSGWLGMIKCIVQYEEKADPIEDFKQKYETVKNGFFSSIPMFMFSILFFIILFAAVSKGLLYAANELFGDPSELLSQIAIFANDKDALVNFLSTLPDDTIASISKRSAFLYSGFIFYLLLTFYAIPSMFFNQNPNPFIALKNGVAALFKKPLFSVLFFISILFAHIVIIFIEAISTVSPILMFFALVLRVCFIAYTIVLIFSVYEEKFTDNCNNRSDSIGENNSCN